jgi:hypothetical protein
VSVTSSAAQVAASPDRGMKPVKPTVNQMYLHAEQQKNKLLQAIGAMDEGTRTIVEMVEAIFHIEDMFTLARGNSFIAMNFMELMNNINYCLLVGMLHDDKINISPVGGENIPTEVGNVLGLGAYQFPNTVKGTVLSVAYCFKIQAAKLNTLIDVNVLTAFMQGSGAAQIAQDTIKSFSNAGISIIKEAASAGIMG